VVAVRVTDDEELRGLNHRFLGRDEPTDVLAFPSDDPKRVGDVAISVERAMAQSTEPVQELRLLAVHGLLHCLGYDHADPQAEQLMWAETGRLLGQHSRTGGAGYGRATGRGA
jgi:probable rRNA maturation factor